VARNTRSGLDVLALAPQARRVDGNTDRAWLDWWANASTRLGSTEVDVEIGSSNAGWDARARLVAIGNGPLEEFEFLCSLDPVFSLRFPDDQTITVRVEATADRREVTLHEYEGPASRAFETRLDV
jgi:hypothetical protein